MSDRKRTPATGDDDATVENFLADLTFKEAHAATMGAVLGFGTVLAFAIDAIPLVVVLVFVYFALNNWSSDTQKTPSAVDRIISSMPDVLVAQIRAEPHYFNSGYILSFIVGGLVLVFLRTFPWVLG
ncbi:MAG: hypothetical protein R3324_00445 [Halobacteriales archaeon]|nr:hypothetical protein [Halobacteriales archaeon]